MSMALSTTLSHSAEIYRHQEVKQSSEEEEPVPVPLRTWFIQLKAAQAYTGTNNGKSMGTVSRGRCGFRRCCKVEWCISEEIVRLPTHTNEAAAVESERLTITAIMRLSVNAEEVPPAIVGWLDFESLVRAVEAARN
jgi:predicted metal-binding protein